MSLEFLLFWIFAASSFLPSPFREWPLTPQLHMLFPSFVGEASKVEGWLPDILACNNSVFCYQLYGRGAGTSLLRVYKDFESKLPGVQLRTQIMRLTLVAFCAISIRFITLSAPHQRSETFSGRSYT